MVFPAAPTGLPQVVTALLHFRLLQRTLFSHKNKMTWLKFLNVFCFASWESAFSATSIWWLNMHKKEISS